MSRLRRAPDRRGPLANLPRRAVLTIRHQGWRRLGYGARFGPELARARRWYRERGRPVTIVIPTFGDPEPVRAAVKSVRSTTSRRRVRVVVVDDCSGPEHRAALEGIEGAEVIFGEANVGFAANVNRGMRVAEGDVVLLNSDIVALDGWLECLQYAAYQLDARVGVVGGRLMYSDGRIQSAGSYRPPAAPEWFDHRYRFRLSDFGPANVTWPALAVTGACLYIRREVVDRVGLMDEDYGMGYEDVDYCLRAWRAGFRVRYQPAAMLTHLESATRGTELRPREAASQRHFWTTWGDWFDRRPVRSTSGRLRVIYVTEDTGVGGGHRDVFEHLNRLAERGHAVELYSCGGQPDWFPLRVPVRSFPTYRELIDDLALEDAIKVATWWNTAMPVWLASVERGFPVYLVQDIESSYYPADEHMRDAVLSSYREEFRYMTISKWNRERLAELGLQAKLIPPGLDLETFRPLALERRDDVILALGRTNPLKNLDLTVDAWRAAAGAERLWLFGIEPKLGERHGARYFDAPTDEEVNRLFNEATVFVQTSTHEGFCLPALEAMASGTAVVCTDAHGNRDFCRDEDNCLMPAPTAVAVADALRRVIDDADLRAELGRRGIETAQAYAWERRIDVLEAFLESVADGRPYVRTDSAAVQAG
jgi:GT2 family glycosyltransferase/glycosyltransferase involved in cell wall biosynthesis